VLCIGTAPTSITIDGRRMPRTKDFGFLSRIRPPELLHGTARKTIVVVICIAHQPVSVRSFVQEQQQRMCLRTLPKPWWMFHDQFHDSYDDLYADHHKYLHMRRLAPFCAVVIAVPIRPAVVLPLSGQGVITGGQAIGKRSLHRMLTR
jgi:hypothetical protein